MMSRYVECILLCTFVVADHNDLSVSMIVHPCPLLTMFSSGFSPFTLSLVSSVIGMAEITDILLVTFISLLGGLNFIRHKKRH